MALPMADIRRTEVVRPEKIPTGLDAWVHRLQGRWRARPGFRKACWDLAGRIEAEMATFEHLGDEELRRRLAEARIGVRRSGGKDLARAEAALGLVAELACRTLGLRPYRVQIMGAIGLFRGRLVEMATGEGKTLTIALAAAVSGWAGRPVHVLTSNDYLAERDASGLRLFYESCGVTVAPVTGGMETAQRREAYAADIVYTTSKELLADFLRDRLVLGVMADAGRRMVQRLLRGSTVDERVVLRGLHTAIVDEADNQMIDEAATPLIISRPVEESPLLPVFAQAHRIASGLSEGTDYALDPRFKEVRLTGAGRERVAEACRALSGERFHQPAWMAILVVQALQARHFFLRDKHYVVLEGKVVIVDESTGRQMPGRSWRFGLHQAIERKEGVEMTPPSESLTRLSFQRFFRLFRRLSGITGTARESAAEFWRVYRLPFLVIPPHRPSRRTEHPVRCFVEASAKWRAIVDEIAEVHASGRPVLVGTRSVAVSEFLGEVLRMRGMPFDLLNAVRHREEAEIIRRAGRGNSITVATNMAGRGTDIALSEEVKRAGGLHVILTEYHESKRIDRQLRGRAGRQGDPGSTRTFLCLEDDLVTQFQPNWLIRGIVFLCGKLLGNQSLIHWFMKSAQQKAEKNFLRQRMLVLGQDRQLSQSLIPDQAVDQL
jgi:preprotein translocase subunit SecA